MNIEAEYITALSLLLMKLREKNPDDDFSFACKFDGDEVVKISNIGSNAAKFEFDGFEYINLEDINLIENGCAYDYIRTLPDLMEPVIGKFNKVEYQDIKRVENDLNVINIDDNFKGKKEEKFSNLCSLFDSIKVELVFSARRNDLTMDGTCQGKFSEASLSLRCVKEYSVTTTIEQNKFEFEGRPSDESEFAGKPYEEKTNESAGTNGSGGKAKGGEAEGEEAEAKPVDINTEIERIFEEIRGKGKIKVRTDKNNKIIAGFNDAFSEAWESRVEKFNIAEGIDLEKIKMEVRTRFRKKAEIAKGSLFGKALKLSDAEENVSKIKRDLDSIGTKENKLDRGLRKVIINTYLKDENIIDIYDDEGNIKGLGEIKEIVKDKMDEFLKKYVGEDYSDQIELVAKDSSQYKKIKRILELTGLEMTDSKEVI